MKVQKESTFFICTRDEDNWYVVNMDKTLILNSGMNEVGIDSLRGKKVLAALSEAGF